MKNKKAFSGLVALLALTIVGGSFAYFTQQDTKQNEFTTGKYQTSLDETFTSPETWTPGTETTKEVLVRNIGNIDVVAKVDFTESWERIEAIIDANGTEISAVGDQLELTFVDESTEKEAAVKKFGENVVILEDVAAFEKVGDKTSLDGKWVLIKDTKKAYFFGTLKGTESTPLFLESVTLNKDVKATIVNTTTVNGENPVTTVVSGSGYDSAKYTLTLTATTVQASADAIKDTFGSDGITTYIADTYATINTSDIVE